MKYEVKIKDKKVIQTRVFDLSNDMEWVDFMSFVFSKIENGLSVKIKRIKGDTDGQDDIINELKKYIREMIKRYECYPLDYYRGMTEALKKVLAKLNELTGVTEG